MYTNLHHLPQLLLSIAPMTQVQLDQMKNRKYICQLNVDFLLSCKPKWLKHNEWTFITFFLFTTSEYLIALHNSHLLSSFTERSSESDILTILIHIHSPYV
jgi:hypothetical protein